jgi:putative FmdB family regulatory protein
MPLYEYRCTSCGKRIEALQRVSAPPLRECPTCHGALVKMISAPALQFKGSGWYVTDYPKGGGRKAGEGAADKAGEPESEGAAPKTESSPTSPSSTDTKPKTTDS